MGAGHRSGPTVSHLSSVLVLWAHDQLVRRLRSIPVTAANLVCACMGHSYPTLYSCTVGSGSPNLRPYERALLHLHLQVRDVSTVLGNCPRPAEPLVLYEFEASPPCRKVPSISRHLSALSPSFNDCSVLINEMRVPLEDEQY